MVTLFFFGFGKLTKWPNLVSIHCTYLLRRTVSAAWWKSLIHFFEIDKHTSNSEKKKIQFLKKDCIGNDLIDIYWDYPLHVFKTFFKRKFEIHIKGWNIKVICQDNTSLSRYIVIWKTRIDGWYIHTVITYGCLW